MNSEGNNQYEGKAGVNIQNIKTKQQNCQHQPQTLSTLHAHQQQQLLAFFTHNMDAQNASSPTRTPKKKLHLPSHALSRPPNGAYVISRSMSPSQKNLISISHKKISKTTIKTKNYHSPITIKKTFNSTVKVQKKNEMLEHNRNQLIEIGMSGGMGNQQIQAVELKHNKRLRNISIYRRSSSRGNSPSTPIKNKKKNKEQAPSPVTLVIKNKMKNNNGNDRKKNKNRSKSTNSSPAIKNKKKNKEQNNDRKKNKNRSKSTNSHLNNKYNEKGGYSARGSCHPQHPAGQFSPMSNNQFHIPPHISSTYASPYGPPLPTPNINANRNFNGQVLVHPQFLKGRLKHAESQHLLQQLAQLEKNKQILQANINQLQANMTQFVAPNTNLSSPAMLTHGTTNSPNTNLSSHTRTSNTASSPGITGDYENPIDLSSLAMITHTNNGATNIANTNISSRAMITRTTNAASSPRITGDHENLIESKENNHFPIQQSELMGQHQGQFHPQQHPLTETNLIQHSKELQKAEAILQMQHEALQSLLVSRRVALQNCTTTQEQAILMAEIQLLEFKITKIQRTRQHAYQESQRKYQMHLSALANNFGQTVATHKHQRDLQLLAHQHQYQQLVEHQRQQFFLAQQEQNLLSPQHQMQQIQQKQQHQIQQQQQQQIQQQQQQQIQQQQQQQIQQHQQQIIRAQFMNANFPATFDPSLFTVPQQNMATSNVNASSVFNLSNQQFMQQNNMNPNNNMGNQI